MVKNFLSLLAAIAVICGAPTLFAQEKAGPKTGPLEHLSFKSKSDVKTVCAELAAHLKAQGWTGEGSDLITATYSILKRKRRDASLTIFVKPEKEGSQ